MSVAQHTPVFDFGPLFASATNLVSPALHQQNRHLPTPAARERNRNDDFYELIRPHERNLYLTVYAVTGNHADAEEVVQETVLKAYLHLDQFRGDALFSTWLMRIAVNEARGLLRKYRRAKLEPIETTLPDGRMLHRDFPDVRETPSERLERQEVAAVIQKVVKMLPAKYQEIFVLRDLKQLSIAETAKQLGITRSTVKARLWRARIKMRRLVAARLEHKPRPASSSCRSATKTTNRFRTN